MKAKGGIVDLILSVKGHTGQIELYENRVDIKRKGFMAFALHGFDGTKSIFLKSITSIQFKEAGIMTSGFIQFTFSGGDEAKKGLFDATKDENTVVFTKEQQAGFEKVRDYIFSKI